MSADQRANGTQITKAVIPAAGLGTRFLPATKSQPKEMLPVVDKPAIQYVVEEAVGAGLTDILIVTGRSKRAIEDHFDRNVELETHLEASGRTELLGALRADTETARIHYVRQREPLGLGHAVSLARDHVGDEPFAVLLGDDLLVDGSRQLRSMIDTCLRTGGSVLALEEVAREAIGAYGCVDIGDEVASTEHPTVQVRSIVEKPDPSEAPSNLAVIGRYVLAPEIFDALEDLPPGRGGEIQLTDGIAALAADAEVYGQLLGGARYDVGTPLGLLRATVELALRREDLGGAVREWLDTLTPDDEPA